MSAMHSEKVYVSIINEQHFENNVLIYVVSNIEIIIVVQWYSIIHWVLLAITDYMLAITEYTLAITDYMLAITDYTLAITDYTLSLVG